METTNRALLPAPAMQNLHDPSGIGYADTLDPHVPLFVRVGPYVTIAAGDLIDLYCNDTLVTQYTVRQEDLTPETPSFVVLPLDQTFITPENITLFYTVTEPIGGLQNASLQAVVPVKLSLPGGTDTNPATPWENEALALPRVSPEGIISSPDGVSVEIAPYLNMSLGDTVTLSWNGQFLRREIKLPEEVGQALTLPVPKEIIELAGDSEMIEVRYEVRDVVNNWSRWSLATYVNVEAGQSKLSAPVVPQAPNMELDLDALSGAAVQVLVLSQPEIEVGDTVMLRVERSTAEGLDLETYSASTTLENVGSFVDFLVPNEQFQPIAQGRARLKYSVSKPNGDLLRSKTLPLKVIGNAMELDAPRIRAAENNNGVLDPTATNVLVEVPPYYFMADGNDVNMVWMGKSATGANVMHEELKNLNSSDIGNPVNFLIPDNKVSALAGGTLEVYYTVTTFARAFFKSPVLQLPVGDDSSVALPAPTVDGVGSDGVLDPELIVLEAIVRVAPDALQLGDTVTLHWDGQGSSGTYTDSTVINGGTVGKEVIFRVGKGYVDANTNSTVDVWYEVARSNQRFLSEQLSFSVGNIVYPTLPTPAIKEAVAGSLDPALAPDGATLIIAADADLREGEKITAHWNGPKGSDTRETVISAEQAGKPVEVVFAAALVSINDGQTVDVSYSVTRASGTVQESEVFALKIQSAALELPAPTMDTVGADGVLRPSLIPESGAIVRVGYRGMQAGDTIVVRWSGASSEDLPSQTAGSETQLLFTLPKALITATEGGTASVLYSVNRDGVERESEQLALTVTSALEFDTSPVVLPGKIYLLPAHPDLLPAFPTGTTVTRVASGGRPPYTYSSSDPKVAQVDANGLTSVRSNGVATITASDAGGDSKSYSVTVNGVVECHGVGQGNYTQMANAASRIGGRVPSIHELVEVYNAYGSRWPMGNSTYWSSTVAKDLLGAKWYYVKNMVSGGNFKLLHINASNGVAIR
ncbi:hypothetical protein ABQX22_19745 [Xanthomonas sp. WHRI 1810A]|uniref:hypothetical protein n=1 Tax=Xanthomonas sp. WHRI 1810A TaxID=3161565 RepID=UPI0032E8D9B0